MKPNVPSLLDIRPAADVAWDCVALGEVMLRLDPGEDRISTARTFRAWEGGGEYNVARGLSQVFGHRTAIVTALVDNPVGRLIEGLMRTGGVDLECLRWLEFDGIGRSARNGLNFTERGFGARAAVGVSDRARSAASQLRAGDIDWDDLFGRRGARWFHSGGIFAGLSDTTPAVTLEAMRAARANGTTVSYDLNYRASLWKAVGGQVRAREVNREIALLVDVMLGNEEDFTAALGFEVEGLGQHFASLDPSRFAAMIERVVEVFPNIRVVATTLRTATTASRNDWGAICWADGVLYQAAPRPDVEILDRVGGGDSFASGLIHGFLTDAGPQRAVELGAAHGALAMTTPGDTSSATLREVETVASGASSRIDR